MIRDTNAPANGQTWSDRRRTNRRHDTLHGIARRVAVGSALILLVSGVISVMVWFCVAFQTVVTPVLLALLGAALLGPLYRRLIAMKVNKSFAAGLTCTAVVVVMGGAAYIVVTALIDTGDQIISSLRDAAASIEERFGLAGTSLDDVAANAKDLLSKFGGTAVNGLLSGVSVVVEMAATGTLAILLMFFFLRDSDRAVSALHSLAPGGTGANLEVMGRRAFQAIEGFMRGTTIVAFIDAVCITVGLLVLDVPGAVGLGALVFIGAYIPYLGALLSGAVAVLVAFADGGLGTALWVLGIVFVVQLLEGNVLQPMILSRTLQMHPAVILVALTAGASVAGVLGMLLAVPMTAAVFGVFSELRRRYEQTPTVGKAPETEVIEDSGSGEDEPPPRLGRRSPRLVGATATAMTSRLPRRLKGTVSGA